MNFLLIWVLLAVVKFLQVTQGIKELFALDGLPSKMSEEDFGRRNTIVGLLAEWGLIDIVDEDKSSDPVASLKRIKIISHKNRDEWELIPKYHIGKKPSKDEE